MSIFRSYRTKEKVSVGLMWGINLATLLYVMIEYPNLPDIIPHHYGFFGEPDEWGGKWMLWIMTGVQIFISAVEHAALHKAIKDSERTGFSDMTGSPAFHQRCDACGSCYRSRTRGDRVHGDHVDFDRHIFSTNVFPKPYPSERQRDGHLFRTF